MNEPPTMHPNPNLLFALSCLVTAGVAHAQRSTEVYIPIGESPGVSGVLSVIGTCSAVGAQRQTVTVRAGDRTWSTEIGEETKIYLDRSQLGLPNTYGTVGDLREDRVMEIKYPRGRRVSGTACEWIKVRVMTRQKE